MKKRFLAGLMALAMTLSLVPATAMAAGSGEIIRAYLNGSKSRITVDMTNVTFEESVELKLYSGEEELTTAALNTEEYGAGTYNELTGSISIDDESDTWPCEKWTAIDAVVPDEIALIVDGQTVDTWEKGIYTYESAMNETYQPITEEDWANFEGTSAVDLVIHTVEELKDFAENVNAGNNFAGKTVLLNDDIDLNGIEWTPIGNSENQFQGTFDGDNHTISNLVITGNESYVGLFGYTTKGKVENLTVENAKVSGYLGVGAIAGCPYTSDYENITLTGHVEINGFAYVGGMLGRNLYADATDMTINVDSSSYVKANSVEGDTAYRTYVGGVIGFMGEGNHTVSNVESNIDVIGSTTDVGGITGIAHYGNTFENISCSGDVTITDATEEGDALEMGGIAGVWHNGGEDVTITNCEFTGDLKANIDVEFPNNGLVGKAYSTTGTGKLIMDVASVNGKVYASLAEAVDKADNGDTVKLLMDAEGTGIVIDKDIVIDFGGNTYALTEPVGSTGTETNGFQILKDNAVTLKNGTLKVAEESAGKFYILVQNYADLKVENMILDGTNLDKYSRTDGDSYTLSNNHGEVVITGNTTIIANDEGDKAFAFDACDFANYEEPKVTVDEDCTVYGKIEVTGDANLVIKGGAFTDLANAVKYAENGAEIALLEDVEGSGIVIDKDITIDFDTNTYDIVGPAVGSAGTTTLGFQILSGNTVTLKDGTITESAPEQNGEGETNKAVKMLVQNYSNLTLEDMVLDGRGLGDGRYVLSNNCGNITITGETEIIAPAVKGIAFDVYRFGSYDAPTVTFDAGFKGGAKGAFEVSEGLEDKLKIHAGYFTQDPTAYVVEGKEVKVIDKDGYKYMVGDPVIDPTPSTSSSKKSSKKYSVEIEDTEDGTVKASSTRVKKDATVTLTVTPDEGYELDDLVVLDKDGEKVKLKDKGNGKYTFTMPRGGVEVEASFVEKEGEKEPVATEKEFIKLTIGQKIVWIFDEYVVNDVAPEIKNDRTMLPIRVIAEALGAKVTWNEAEQKVTIAEDDLTIEIFIGQPFATVNGKPVQLDAPAYIANGRTYLPLRFVAENLGATVEWNAVDSSVTIFK